MATSKDRKSSLVASFVIYLRFSVLDAKTNQAAKVTSAILSGFSIGIEPMKKLFKTFTKLKKIPLWRIT